MYYAPHKLEKKVAPVVQMDDFGRPVTESAVQSWVYVGECRCDKTSDNEKKSDNGNAFVPSYKIVLGCRGMIASGDIVRVLSKDDGHLICQGEARCPRENNYYDYSEIWVE